MPSPVFHMGRQHPLSNSTACHRLTPSPPTSRQRTSATSRCSGACATGGFRASATGAARSRSSTATLAVRCRCPTSSCRWCCRWIACPTARATRSPSSKPFSPAPARNAASRRGARPTRWTPSSTRAGTTRATPASSAATAMVDEETSYWMPVDQYIGGIEHAILHLLYSRFWSKVMRDLKLVSYDEPFAHLLTQGMVLNHIFSRRGDKGGISYFAPEEVDLAHDASGKITGATRQGRRPAGQLRRHRHHVEVQAQRRRPAVADRALRRRHRALLHDVRQPAGADARMERCRRRWRVPIPAPGVGVRPRIRQRTQGEDRRNVNSRRRSSTARWAACAARSTCCSSRPTTISPNSSSTPSPRRR